MSKRAEEAALKAYPVREEWYGNQYGSFGDVNKQPRLKFQQGYEQAEKDLALSIDDIEKIHTFLYAVKNNKQGVFTFTRLSDEQYKEVLQRFINVKNEQRLQM